MQDLIARLRAGTVTPADLDAAADALEKADEIADAAQFLMEMAEPPERNCSCHLAPPCGWCVEYSGVAEAYELTAKAFASWEALK